MCISFVLIFRHAIYFWLQELILEKVREDMMVRMKISQSSALRQKRGHSVVNQRPETTETDAPVDLDNNGTISHPVKNGHIHAYDTTGEPENIFDKMEELKIFSGSPVVS